MKFHLRQILTCILFLLACPFSIWAQQATINRNVILRRDPSTTSPVVAHLRNGARVTLVDLNPDSGFYHVRTEDDQVGWVSAKAVTVSKASPPVTPAPTTPVSPTPGPGATDTTCDPGLQGHVYHPARLIQKQSCIAVTGTIVDATKGSQPDGVRHEADGDTHGWLNVDAEFKSLLNAGNINDESGNLVFEIICRFPVTQPDAKAACQGFTDQVNLPPINSHVRIVGTLVQDTFHGQWMEIHPVTSITVIP
jgi:hypothetical protein